jgi:DNA replication protein DnaC
MGVNMSVGGIRDILSLDFLVRKETLIFSGSLHSDMNDLVRALGGKAEEQGTRVLIIKAGTLLERLLEKAEGRPSDKDEWHPDKAGLLIIEDFGTQKLSPQQADFFSRIISARLERASTIITSASLLKQWLLFLEGSEKGKELFQALLRRARQVVIGGGNTTTRKEPAPTDVPAQAFG